MINFKHFQVIIYIFCLFLALNAVQAYDIELNASYNLSEIPVSGNFTFKMSTNQTKNVTFTKIDNSELLQMTGLNKTLTILSTETFTVKVNYSISEFVPYSDIMELREVYSIENGDYNETKYLAFKIYVLDDSEDLINETSHQAFRILNGELVFEYSTNLLPIVDAYFYVNLTGAIGDRIHVTQCGNWMECPETKDIVENNMTQVKIRYQIPEDAGTGDHNQEIYFLNNRTNQTKTLKVNFKIVLPDLKVERYIYPDWCWDTPEDLMECKQNELNYEQEKLYELMNRYFSNNQTNATNTTITEYIEISEFDPELAEKLAEAQFIIERQNALIVDQSLEAHNITQMSETITNLANKIEEFQTQYFESLTEMRKQVSKDTQEAILKDDKERKSKRNKAITTWIVLIIIIILIIDYFATDANSNWRTKR